MNQHHHHHSYLSLAPIYIALLILLASGWISADDVSGLDMNALASLASTIGSNPQIMSMVSNLLNQQNSARPPPSTTGGFDTAALGVSLDQDPMNLPGTTSAVAADPVLPPQLAARSPSVQQQQQQQQHQQQPQRIAKQDAVAQPSTGVQGTNSLSSLMSLLPSVLPAMNKAAQQQTSVLPAAPHAAAPPAAAAVAAAPIAGPIPQPIPQPAGGNPAQSVINQVLSAYVSGQIPPEMIQLGLSGRVPPQIMELALSGQVPPQIIQMVITGQIPLSTINAFLNTMQPAGAARSTLTSTIETVTPAPVSTMSPTGGGFISTTRALMEAIFRPSGGRKIMVPTLLGPLPIQIPAIPSVRQFGKMVGSSISSMASMVPF